MNKYQEIYYKNMTYNEITMARKTITISEETHRELVKVGVYGESMDDIIKKLLNHYKGESNITVKPSNVD
jgi:predicted CopG family antitoxin